MKETGIDGYRLDAVRYLVETGPKEGQQDTPGTLEYWREFASGVLASYPEAMLLGEAWASNSIISAYRKDGKGLNISFDFDLMESIVAGVLAEEPADLEGVLCRLPGQFPSGSSEVTFLSNHDLTRVFSRLKAGASAMKFAAALLFTLPGTPMVYYGDEIGMQNGPLPKDEHKRLPMQWDATANAGFSTGTPWQKPAADYPEVNVQAQAAQSDSLLSWYRSLIALRRSTPALDAGGFQLVQAKSATTPLVWAFVRYLGQQQVYVVANFSNNPAVNVTVEFQAGGAAPGQRESAATLVPPGDAVVPATPPGYSVGDVPAQSIVVFRSSSAP
jgi:glycosidase